MDVVPFCNHLCPYEQVDLPGMQPHQQPLHITARTHRVTVHPTNTSPREKLLQPLLALLRSRAHVVQVFTLALRALRRNSPPKPAIVAFQPLPHPGLAAQILRPTRLVIRQRNCTIFALDLCPAASAHHHKAVPAPVQQDDHLLIAIQGSLRLRNQLSRKQLFPTRRPELLPHIDHLDHRKRPLHHPLQHLDTLVPSALRIRPAFKRRRSRT